MKKLIVLVIATLSFFIVKIPNYIELNSLCIVENMSISYKNNIYNIYIKEIIPYKGDNGITYKYVYYNKFGSDLDEILKKIEKKSHKSLYFSKMSYLIIDSNSDYKNSLIHRLKRKKFNAKHILYTNKDVKKIVRKHSNY